MIATGAQRLIAAVLDCEKPVVAAVNGTAAGIGAHLAFACDLVVAAEGARFIEVFVRRGILPDGGRAYLLPRLIGLQKAKELIFFGDDLPASGAVRLRLVSAFSRRLPFFVPTCACLRRFCRRENNLAVADSAMT